MRLGTVPTYILVSVCACAWVFAPVAVAQSIQAGAKISKTPLYPDAQGGLSKFTNLTGVLPRQSFTLGLPGESDASKHCTAQGLDDECAGGHSTWSVQTATYGDHSNAPVYVCICDGSAFDAQGLASTYSHVPLFLRQWVTSISFVPEANAHAYTAAGHITFFGSNNKGWADVMVHESTHAQDQGFSNSQTYLKAVGKDSCVPDEYAQTNNVENYAQDMVVFLYTLWKPINPPSPSTDCMSHQLTAIRASSASGLQDYIKATEAATTNKCEINCQYTAKKGDTLAYIAAGCPGQSPESLLPYNPQMNSVGSTVYPGENICFPASCCSQARRLLRK